MPWLDLDAVVAKVYDLLRYDSRTKDIAWHNGRRSALQLHQMPAGIVFLGPGSITAYTIPRGERATVRVVVEIVSADHDLAVAERAMRVAMDAVMQVLIDEWNLGLAPVHPESLGWEIDANPEQTPPTVAVRIMLEVQIYPVNP